MPDPATPARAAAAQTTTPTEGFDMTDVVTNREPAIEGYAEMSEAQHLTAGTQEG